MILTVTMNPAIDISTTTEKFYAEKKLRCSAPLIGPGGGGINVSKAVKELGGQTLALFPAGGLTGARLQEMLKQADIPVNAIAIKGETRENMTVTDLSLNRQYRFVMPGPEIDQNDLALTLAAIESIYPAPSFIVASGSLPSGAPEDFFARLSQICEHTGSRLIADTSGIPLEHAMNAGVYLIKPNMTELCALAGKPTLEFDSITVEARALIRKTRCHAMLVSMGPSGALLVTRDYTERIPAPPVRKINAVGAGDSVVAGVVWMLEQGNPLSAAARFGVACGTAATMNPGTALFRKEDAFHLYEWINQEMDGKRPCA